MQKRKIFTGVLRRLDTTVHFSYLNKLSYWQTHFLFPDIRISQQNDHLKNIWIIPNNTSPQKSCKIAVLYAI